MTDLTDNAGGLHRAKPRGAIAWPSATGGASRRIAVSCPCEASRAIACWPDEVSRPFCILGAHDLRPDCLTSLRPSERNGTEMQSAKLK